ncbi:S-formylglutathione hydrolase [Thioalkalivibrio sp. HK1]|uniref:S-formylglutathione hydrolase n=1 Tax=Thioalkalivibrio sp. HK1 TaxID=1469245 RepID=UPI0018CC0495|nr:S-formylglutathione hydrolase [Thioalkalivibrio sp. HK1]
MEVLAEHRCHEGVQGFYRHDARTTATSMRFAVYLPPAAQDRSVPVIYYLAGLTCTEETATIKAGAQAHAARLGLALVMPDTSPRGANIEGEDDDWDFGTGAGFYLDATSDPWSRNYRMYSYITDELRELVASRFPVLYDATGICGHSMGGHGALVIALRNPDAYRTLSAFAPICAPMQCPWGEKAFSSYLKDDPSAKERYDAVSLISSGARFEGEILVDQGEDDPFLKSQLHPHLLQEACEKAGLDLQLRRHPGYDHGYYFIQSLIGDHLEHHARGLGARS